jgi:hypothetical protein
MNEAIAYSTASYAVSLYGDALRVQVPSNLYKNRAAKLLYFLVRDEGLHGFAAALRRLVQAAWAIAYSTAFNAVSLYGDALRVQVPSNL